MGRRLRIAARSVSDQVSNSPSQHSPASLFFLDTHKASPTPHSLTKASLPPPQPFFLLPPCLVSSSRLLSPRPCLSPAICSPSSLPVSTKTALSFLPSQIPHARRLLPLLLLGKHLAREIQVQSRFTLLLSLFFPWILLMMSSSPT